MQECYHFSMADIQMNTKGRRKAFGYTVMTVSELFSELGNGDRVLAPTY